MVHEQCRRRGELHGPGRKVDDLTGVVAVAGDDLAGRDADANGRKRIVLLERGDDVEVVFAYARSSKIAVLSVRSDADMAAAKKQAQ